MVYLKKDVDPHLVLNQLYEYSPLQKTVSIILLALADGRPKVMTLKEMMQEFIKHRMQVIRRRTEFQLREAKRRGHFLEGQLIAFSSIDEIIRVCRAAPDRNEAKQQLMVMTVAAAVLGRALGEEAFTSLQREIGVLDEYHMTEQQAEAIVRLQIGQLANLERDEIFREYAGLREQIISYEALLSSEATILAEVRQDLEDIRKKYGDARKTEISDEGGSVNLEDLIKEEDVVVSISHGGYVKRLEAVAAALSGEDFIEHFFVASTHAYLLVFTNRGQCHWLKVYDIPEAARTSGGRSIANVLTFRPDEKLESLIPVRHFEENTFLMMATRNGLVKKTELTEYSRPRQGGVIGINLEEGDALIDVALVRPGDEVVLSTKQGMAIRFSESDARPMGRNTMGVKGISLRAGDELVGMVVADPEGALLTVCENGYGKRTPFGPNTETVDTGETGGADEVAEEPESTELIAGAGTGEGDEADAVATPSSAMRYRRQRRGGKGVKDIKTSERNGQVVGVVPVRGDTDDVMLITLQGMVTRIKVSEIRMVGRNTQGVKVITPSEGDKLASVAKLAREEVSAETEAVTPPAITDTPPPAADAPPAAE